MRGVASVVCVITLLSFCASTFVVKNPVRYGGHVAGAPAVTVLSPRPDGCVVGDLKIEMTVENYANDVELWINDRNLGQINPRAPYVVPELPPGPHWLRVVLLDASRTTADVEFTSYPWPEAPTDMNNKTALQESAMILERCGQIVPAFRIWKTLWRMDFGDNLWRFEVGRMMLHHGRAEQSLNVLRYLHQFCAMPLAKPRPTDRQTVVIMCFPVSGDNWGPSKLDGTGIGGSEEAVILLSKQLTALGYWVEVYNATPQDEMGVDKDGVQWLPFCMYQHQPPPDIFIAWRHAWCVSIGNARASFVWLHDTVEPHDWVPAIVNRTNGIFVLSKMERARLPPLALPKAVVTANGLDERYFAEGANHKHRFIYSSSPDRGLEQLLLSWGQIKQRVPDAVLEVYYGFNKNFDRMYKPEVKQYFLDLLAQPGVEYYGLVNQRKLASAIANVGFWLYPTSFEETSCITAMKCQAMGAIPITSRHPDSALNETCGLWDLGPMPPYNGHIKKDPAWLQLWVDTVVDVVTKPDGYWDEHRRKMKEWARQKFPWRSVALQWHNEFQRALGAA